MHWQGAHRAEHDAAFAANADRKDVALPFADINLGEALLVAFEVFFFVIWIWILITILTDLFRDHETLRAG